MTYTSRITIAVPTDLMPQANQLALLIGESEADVNTFTQARYTKDGIDYALSSSACVPRVVSYLTEGLPHDPDSGDILNPNDANLLAAGEAFVAIQQGLILVSTNVDPSAAIDELGVTPLPSEDEI